MRREQEKLKPYEEECRSRRIGLNESLRKSSLRLVVETNLWHNSPGSAGMSLLLQSSVGIVVSYSLQKISQESV